MERRDYLIVGGGTAGAVVARRLADAGADVLLLEGGHDDRGVDVIRDLRRWSELLGGRYDYDYAIEPQPRGNGGIRHSRGKMLGGCSSHNSCIAFFPPAEDLDRWEAGGCTGWGAADLAQEQAAVTRTVNLERGPDNDLVDAFVEACAQAGLPKTDFSGPFNRGADRFRLNKRGTDRQSSSAAYLTPRDRLPKNLEIRTATPVRAIRFAGTHARSVLTEAGEIEAAREIVVACGAFDTPKLLMLSGIGPADHLRSFGIPVVTDLPVGDHLLDHPEGVLIWKAKRPIPEETVQRYEAGAFATIDPEAAWPDVMFHFGLEAFDMNTLPAGFPTAEHAFSLTPNVTRAKSEGTVRLRSTDPTAPPRIDFAYFTDPEGYDERIMLAGARLAREIVAQPALLDWVDVELAPGAAIQDGDALSDYIRSTANTVYHPAGTCRMTTVVDEQLRVLGIEGLRVADASVFHDMVSVNPAMTVMMIGERCARLLLEG